MTKFIKIWLPNGATKLSVSQNSDKENIVVYKIGDSKTNHYKVIRDLESKVEFIGVTHCSNRENSHYGQTLAHFAVVDESYRMDEVLKVTTTELRSSTVRRAYRECVLCEVAGEIGVFKNYLRIWIPHIKDMVGQLPTDLPMNMLHTRLDGEQWTPYLQVVRMLVLLGEKIKILTFDGKLTDKTIIRKV
jgi:hypothetical protein